MSTARQTSPPNRLPDWAGRWWFWPLLAALIYTPWIDVKPGTGNVASDLAAIESLAERGTFFINGSLFEGTIDKFKRDERYFSQKSPVFHLVAVVPVLAMKSMGLHLVTDLALELRVLTFVLVILPMGALLGLIFHHPWLSERGVKGRFALTLAFALGSLMTPFATTLNHYVPAAAALMAAVQAITAAGLDARGFDRRRAVAVGFWVSVSLACDVPPAFLFGLGVAGYCLVRARGALPGLLLGAAPLVLLYASLNFHIIGSPLPANLHEQEMLYYEGSYWSELRARAEGGEPGYYQASYARRLWHSALGHKGMLWMMPLLAWAAAAAVALARRRARGWPLALAWLAFPLIVVAVAMIWAFDLSGGAYVIRHALASVAPLYCVLGHPALEWRGRARRWGFVFASAAGGIVAWIGVLDPWSHNTLSAYPPLENLARFSLRHSERFPTQWIGSAIARTSVTEANGWLDLGLAHLEARRLVKAESALLQATRTDPTLALNYYHLGIVQDMRGRPEAAIESYRRLMKLEPENVGAWNNLGLFALQSGQAQLARSSYERSQELRANPSAAWGLLLCLELEGSADPDSPLLQKALALYPEDARIGELARRWRSRSN